MISVVGSKILTNFSATYLSPPKIRCLACRITCWTLGIMVSSSFRNAFRAACCITSADRFTPWAISPQNRLACPTTRPTADNQLLVSLLQSLTIRSALGPHYAPDFQNAKLYAPATITQFGSLLSSDLSDPLHGAGQHAHAISQKIAVGRVVDIGLDHRGIQAHLAPLHYLIFLGVATTRS